MKIIETKKFAESPFKNWRDKITPENTDRANFVKQVKRLAHNATVQNALRIPEFGNVDIFRYQLKPAEIGLGTAMNGKVYRTCDLEQFYINKDVQGAVQYVLQETKQLAQDPTFEAESRSLQEGITREVENYERKNPNGNWAGD